MDKKTLLVGIFALVLIAITAVGVVFFAPPVSLHGAVYDAPYPPAPEVALTRANGNHFRLSELRGNVVLLFFGYTSCPDVCPTTLAELKTAVEQVGDTNAERVKVVFVTVDPQRDSPQRVQEYVDHFNERFIGLSGAEVDLAPIWNGYGVFRQVVDEGSASGYGVDHTARITLIDQEGNIRSSYSTDTPVKDIVQDLKLLLK